MPPNQRQRHGNLPAQQPSRRTPFKPSEQADINQFPPLQRPHEPGYGGPPPVYVVSTFDARPLNAVDFITHSGSDLGGADNPDVGQVPDPDGYETSSIFYLVPPGFVAVLRDWHIRMQPLTGDPIGEGQPVITEDGDSNFPCRIQILVNGNVQNGQTFLTYGLAFGDVFGECYVIAPSGAVIELRVTAAGADQANFPVAWTQALIALHGNLLFDKGYQQEFMPGTDAVLPVHETAPVKAGVASEYAG